MGKAQYKKKTAKEKRHNPIRVPDAHLGGGREAGQADPQKAEQVLPILAKLKSPEYADRTWACAAVCNLVQNDAATRRLFQSRNVVGELVERLSDSVDEVVVEASGALRNLAIDGGHELCGEMFNKGIMPHLAVLMGKISGTIANLAAPTGEGEYQARKHLLALAENVLALLWSLAETSHRTLAAVNAAHPEALLFAVLDARAALGPGPALAAAQALYSLAQDNPEFRRAALALNGGQAVRVLVDVAREVPVEKSKGKKAAKGGDGEAGTADGRAALTRLLACGAIRSLADAADPDVAALTADVVVPLCTAQLDVEPNVVAARVLELVGQIQAAQTGPRTDFRSAAEIELERIERRLVTVAVALEVLTGVCAGLEDAEAEPEDAVADEAMDEDDDDDGELADEVLIERGRDPSAPAPPAAPSPAVHSLPALSAALPALLVPLAIPTTLSFAPPGQASAHPPTTAALSTLHLRALEALNNLLLTVAAAGGSAVAAPGAWDAMFETMARAGAGADAGALAARGQEMRMETVEAAVGCLWGLARLGQMTQTLLDAAPLLSPASRARLIDLAALLAARPGVPVPDNASVGSWLLAALARVDGAGAVPASDVVAVVNAIIDVYADEEREYDGPVFVAGDYLGQLVGAVAKVRAEARKIDRRRDAELRARADEAYDNLVAFIKYRRGLRR